MKRKRISKIISVTVLLCLLTISAAGCGGGETSSSDNGNVTITVSTRYEGNVPDEEFYRQKVEEFNELDNGITVVMDNITTESDYLDKLRTSFANGDSPNVFQEYGGSRVLDYVESDALVDMQPYFEEDTEWYDSFYLTMFDGLQYEEYEGIWGVPFKAYTVGLYYNTEIFEEQNLTPPTTWDELLEVCEKLTEAGIKPFQAGEKDTYRFGHLHNNIAIKSLGADVANQLADRTLSYDSPELIETYSLISEMVEKGYLGTDILNTDVETEKSTYVSEGCAMRWDGSWYVSEIFGTEIYDKTDVVPMPYIDEEYQYHAQGGASDMLFVSKLNKSDEEIAASIEFIKYVTSEEYYAQNNEVASVIYPAKFTPTEATPDNPLLDKMNGFMEEYTVLSGDLQNIDPESHMIDTVRNALQGLGMGNTPEQCGEEIVSRMSSE